MAGGQPSSRDQRVHLASLEEPVRREGRRLQASEEAGKESQRFKRIVADQAGLNIRCWSPLGGKILTLDRWRQAVPATLSTNRTARSFLTLPTSVSDEIRREWFTGEGIVATARY